MKEANMMSREGDEASEGASEKGHLRVMKRCHTNPSKTPLTKFPLRLLRCLRETSLSFVLGFGVLGFGVSGAFSADRSSPALSRFLSAQTNLQTWSADLTQIRRLKTLTQPLVSTGKVWFAAPNKFRWEIGSPPQTIAMRGGDEMLVLYPRLKRVEKYPLTGEQMGPWKDTLALLEAGFPRSEAEMTSRFKLLSVTSTNGVFNAIMEPRSSSARRMMPLIGIVFAGNDFQLLATELQFADGSTMRNEFRNTHLNRVLDPALFTPRIEPDWKVVNPIKH
jgi:outer membrane lipoprotein-sorting protein